MIIREIEDLATALEENDLSNVSAENLLRSSCSKHYYHLFHLVGEWLKRRFSSFIKSSGGSTHQTLRVCCELLSDHYNDKDFQKINLKLKALHDVRVHADYRLGDDFKTTNLMIMKSEKNRIFELITNIEVKYFSSQVKEA
ncbi:hypothetical protein [Acinetobacter sp. ANC 5600]|uniref:hypothetical protein n=1 Tax=Acinetobacter sp. ANC 5600 TaxID=1960940 RepID=UPI00099385D7|nr:hypothetical protein [Acinetobacter sp. ANC 5600]OOV83811.1 hypothetical protein B1201_00740 [Acinetobacter sp. ANC 5600]